MGALHLDYLICNIFAVDLIRKSLKKGERQMRYYELDFEWDWDYNSEEVEEVWDKYYD